MTIVDKIAEKIHRRRRQILVHSIIYYNFDDNLITDAVYDTWARELAQLQRDHPHISELVHYHYEAFKDFTTSTTGFNLPLRDVRANKIAWWLLQDRDSKRLHFPKKLLSKIDREEIHKGWLKYHLSQEPYPPRKVSADI